MISVDTETTGLHPDDGARVTVLSMAWRDDGGVLRSGAWNFGLEGAQRPQATWDRTLAGLSRNALVMQNAKFDLTMLRAGTVQGWAGIDLSQSTVWDTMVAQLYLDPGHSVGLKATAERLGLMGGDEASPQEAMRGWLKENKLRLSEISKAPWEVVRPYATRDAELTLLLYELQVRRLQEGEGHVWALIEREFRVLQVLFEMEMRGIGFDAQACREAAVPLRREWEASRKLLPFEPTLPRAKKYFFGELGLIPHKSTHLGSPQLDEEVLRKLVDQEVPGARAYQRYRQLESALTKWYETWPELTGADGRLRTVFSQTAVRSGRFSVSRVQLQAIPHDHQIPAGVRTIRSLFRPREGASLWEMDLSQAEVRVATSVAKCKAMLEILVNGEDVHDGTCRRIFGLQPEDPTWKKHRDIAKRLNFGTIYGGGVRALMEAINNNTEQKVSTSYVEGLIADYRHVFPEFYRAGQRAMRLAEGRGWVRLSSGRQRWFGPDEGYHKAFNAIIQGSVAETMKDWMIEIETRFPTILILQIHDSIVLEIPQGLEEETLEKVQEAGNRIFTSTFKIPFKIDRKEWK